MLMYSTNEYCKQNGITIYYNDFFESPRKSSINYAENKSKITLFIKTIEVKQSFNLLPPIFGLIIRWWGINIL